MIGNISILVVISICLAVSLIFSELFYRLKYPRVIGQIVSGIILGTPFFAILFTTQARDAVTFLSELGVVFLLLLTGMEINLSMLKKSQRDVLLIATSCALLPFALGYGLGIWLGYSKLQALILGASLSLTAEGTNLKVLIDMNLLNTKVGAVMLGAGITDDVFEVIFLASTLLLVNQISTNIAVLPILILMFILIVFTIVQFIPKLITFIHNEHDSVVRFSTMLVVALLIVGLSTILGLGEIIGAFIAGIIIQVSNHYKKEEHQLVDELSAMSFSLLVPFFFINIGLHFDLMSIFHNLTLTLLVLFVGIAGKVGGTFLVYPFTSLNVMQSWIVGWGMNSRAAVELVIVEIARVSGIISTELYSAIVAMAVLTTLMFPFIMKYHLKRNPHIMNEKTKMVVKERARHHM